MLITDSDNDNITQAKLIVSMSMSYMYVHDKIFLFAIQKTHHITKYFKNLQSIKLLVLHRIK